ncbi:MAG: response regulator transcription factor [Paludibacter sp.]|nr:response regulator transcription factor [Paludibacter sp.]
MEDKLKIMLVDDHQIVIDGIKSMLVRHGRFEVIDVAFSGEEAWTKIIADPIAFDIITVDISLPGMNGIELCRKIKSYNGNIKVMILSMYNEASYVRNAIYCEADGYMLKNCGKKEFLHGLEALTDKGSYFAYDIIPLIYSETKKEKEVCHVNLTTRETEILKLILQEFTSREIADKLYISKQTVDTHRLNIMEKTNSKSVVGLIKYAIRNKLI